MNENKFYLVLELGRADLIREGYDVSKVNDDTMKEIATRMGDGMTDPAFWISLRTVADEMKIPKLEKKDD